MSSAFSVSGVMGWIDDRVNPIVIKELRQAVQSRFIVSVLMLLLVVLVTTMLLFVINTDSIGLATSNHGNDLFQIFHGMLLTTCLLFVPVYVGVRLIVERASTTSDLLFVSTIRPSSIVWGKLLAGMIVSALILSACAPFMVVTYLLRGIDPPTIFFVIGLDLLVVLAAIQIAILIGAVPISWLFKILLGAMLGFLLLMSIVFIIGELVWEINRWGIGSQMGDWRFWAPVLTFVVSWFAGVGLVFFVTVAMISPPPSNRAFPLRVYVTSIWVLSLGVFVYMFYYTGDGEFLIVWACFASVLLLVFLLFSFSERDIIGPRLRRSIPQNRLLRIPAFFLFSGAAGGLLWSILMICLTLGGVWAGGMWIFIIRGFSGPPLGDYELELLASIAIAGMYLLAYGLTAVLLRRLFFKHPAAVASTAAIAVFMIALGCIVPVIVAFATDPTHWDTRSDYWLILNPLGAMFDADYRGRWSNIQQRGLIVSVCWSALMLTLSTPWIFRQIRAFKPLIEDAPSEVKSAKTGTQADG